MEWLLGQSVPISLEIFLPRFFCPDLVHFSPELFTIRPPNFLSIQISFVGMKVKPIRHAQTSGSRWDAPMTVEGAGLCHCKACSTDSSFISVTLDNIDLLAHYLKKGKKENPGRSWVPQDAWPQLCSWKQMKEKSEGEKSLWKLLLPVA